MAPLLLLSLWLLASVQSLESHERGRQRGPILLTDETFDDTVLNRDDIWLVLFYAPCTGCYKNFEPVWTSAAIEVKKKTKGKAKLAAVDISVNHMLASRYGVHDAPTIKVFQRGEDPVDYYGERTKSDIVTHALYLLSEHVPAPDILQIISDVILRQTCYPSQQCIISFLPHILDTGAAGRNSYLELLLTIADKYRKMKWGWLWSEAGAQSELESSLGIGEFGYPAMVAVNLQRMKYALLKGSFSVEGINEFLRKISLGDGSTLPLVQRHKPKIYTVEPWDGKDGELPVEIDTDLSDVELDELENQKDEL